MHAEIELVKAHVLGLFERQREYLQSKPTAFLEELLHRCEDRIEPAEFSTMVSQQVNHAACSLVLEDRQKLSAHPIFQREIGEVAL